MKIRIVTEFCGSGFLQALLTVFHLLVGTGTGNVFPATGLLRLLQQ